MDSDYEKILEDSNEKLKEQLEREHEEIDKYKDYFDLLMKSEIIEFQRHGADDCGWGNIISSKDIKEVVHLVIKTRDFHDFPLLHEKIDEFHRERRRLYSIREENEVKWEKRKKILLMLLIIVAGGFLLWGLGWAVWWAYIAVI